MLPLLKHYSWHMEDIYNKLESLSIKISKVNPSKFKDPNKIEKANLLQRNLLYHFDLLEKRLFQLIKEINDLDIFVCSPIFGAMDIPMKSERDRLVYLCFDHTIENIDEFLCHKSNNKIKKSRLSRYLDC